jgi:diguanylate cyclase (GGDEF)-like protein
MVSSINALGVRVRDRDDLFRSSCRIAVEHGEFELAWIGVVDHSGMKIVPMASAGLNEKAMAAIQDVFAGDEGALQGQTLTARAIREKAPVVSNDVENDVSLILGKMHAESGVRSIAVLPLIVSDIAIGVFVLYTSKLEFFDAAGLLLLTELAGNIASAIDHIEQQERLDRFAYYDALTGLANRSLFLDRVTQHIFSAANRGHKLAVFLIDLERFKKFNDSLGRPAGDALLKQVAEWLGQNAGNSNALARVAADHFAVVLPEVTYEADAVRSLENMIAALLSHPFRVNDAVYRVAAKVGVALFPDDGVDADTLFKNAEAALKKAKVSGDRYLFFALKMTETVAGSLGIENRLRQALEREEFVLHYQPKMNLTSGKLVGAEALIRWNDPQTGLLPPARFIPILEEMGLIHEVGRWALHKAIEDYQRWRSAGLPAVRIAVNVSPLQLRDGRFFAEIQEAISIAAGAAAGLELEITESLIMEDVNHSIASLLAIRALAACRTDVFLPERL